MTPLVPARQTFGQILVGSIFTQSINVYTNVQSTTPVAVYATGYVMSPGGSGLIVT